MAGAGVNALMGLGFPAEQARRLGNDITAVNGVGTAQVGGTTLKSLQNYVRVTTSSGQTAVVLPAGVPIGYEVIARNLSSTAALLYPESGGAIDGGSTDASVSIAQNRSRIFTKVAALTWESVYGA